MERSHNQFVNNLRGGNEGIDDSPRTQTVKYSAGDFTCQHGRYGIYGDLRTEVSSQSLLRSRSHPSINHNRKGFRLQRKSIGKLSQKNHDIIIINFIHLLFFVLFLCFKYQSFTFANKTTLFESQCIKRKRN